MRPGNMPRVPSPLEANVWPAAYSYIPSCRTCRKVRLTVPKSSKIIDQGSCLMEIGLDSQSAKKLASAQALSETPVGDDALRPVLDALVRYMGIKVTQIKDILIECPELLVEDAEELKHRYDSLEAAWPSTRSLHQSIVKYPRLLEPTFPTRLHKFMEFMLDLGMAPAQTAEIIVKEPQIVDMRRFEINNCLKRFGIDPSKGLPQEELKTFILKTPEVLTTSGSMELASMLQILQEFGLDKSAALDVALVTFGTLKKQDDTRKTILHIHKTLKKYLEEEKAVLHVIHHWPKVLTLRYVMLAPVTCCMLLALIFSLMQYIAGCFYTEDTKTTQDIPGKDPSISKSILSRSN